MSFVIGMATGYETRKLQEERTIRQRILHYIESTGIRLTDRTGRIISPDEFFSQILGAPPSRRTVIIGAIVALIVAGIAVTTGVVLWQII
ncbi:MAG: hypothetical protein JWN70_3198 [Planctomycetaceae bacterium]|nr:hypothetical protein [Planctomycetaceae bacterium]